MLEVTKIEFFPLRGPDESRFKARVNVVFNEGLQVNGFRILEGVKGLFLAFPSEPREGTDTYFNYCYPLNREVAARVEKVVLDAWAGFGV